MTEKESDSELADTFMTGLLDREQEMVERSKKDLNYSRLEDGSA